jgi:hypothetical protein
MNNDEYKPRKEKLLEESNRALSDLRNFNNQLDNSPKRLLDIFKNLDRIQEEIEDLILEIEIDDFLENGNKNKV